MRKRQMVGELDSIVLPDTEGGGAPFADAVQREDGRLLEGAGEERARSVALVVVREDDGRFQTTAKRLSNRARNVQLLLEPHGQGHREAAEADRRVREIRLEEPLKLAKRLLVKGHMVDLSCGQAGFAQTILNGLAWKISVVLLPGESFFLCG